MKIQLDENKRYQTFESFGASGAWWAQIVGGWTHTDEASGLTVRDRISQLLYSKTQGIGLGVYRYNIGGGSAQSGNGDIENPLRRAESFDLGAGRYDFCRDRNAVYMMKQAVRDGADEVILFVNSPIERLTKNHKTHLNKYQLFRDNLSRKNYKAFADYCLDVTEHFVNEGLPVHYLSPINEPIWVWIGGQEGCHYHPWTAAAVMECFAKELKKRSKLKGVKLSGIESGDIRWFNKSYTREFLRSQEVRDCIDSVDIHSYCLPIPKWIPLPFLNDRLPFLYRFRKWMDKHYPGMPLKMSEWTHMQGGRDKGMDSALVMAKVMVEDISILNVTSWQHWIAVSEVDYCDGLIYINLDDMTFEMTKRYYATGNFSKYIPRGAVRIDASCDDDRLKLLAFRKDNRTILIVINDSASEIGITLPEFGANARIAVTNEKENLTESVLTSPEIAITPKSVNTIIWEDNT